MVQALAQLALHKFQSMAMLLQLSMSTRVCRQPQCTAGTSLQFQKVAMGGPDMCPALRSIRLTFNCCSNMH